MPLVYIDGELRTPIPARLIPIIQTLGMHPGEACQMNLGKFGQEADMDILFVMPE